MEELAILMKRQDSNLCISFLSDDIYSDWILSMDICECREEVVEEVEDSKNDNADERHSLLAVEEVMKQKIVSWEVKLLMNFPTVDTRRSLEQDLKSW